MPAPDLNIPTPKPEESDVKEIADVSASITEIDLEDSAVITDENMQALLARAKQAGRQAAKKTKMAFDTTRALADSGMLKIPPRSKRHKRSEVLRRANGTG